MLVKNDSKSNIKNFKYNEDQKAEETNNNLHIWELARVLKTVGEVVGQANDTALGYRVLAPVEIADLFKDKKTKAPLLYGAASKGEDSTIIAALNGPMAHIYIKGFDWSTAPDVNEINKFAEIIRLTLQGTNGGASPLDISPQEIIDALPDKIGRLGNSVDEILIRDGGTYKVYTVDYSSGKPQIDLKDIEGYFSSKYVAAKLRIDGMNHGERAGDIVLIMKDEVNVLVTDIQNQRYTTGVACKSWHGSLNRSDSFVPFIITYPGGNKSELEQVLQKDTICSMDYSLCNGNWKLSDIVKEIIAEQYK